MCGQLKAAVMLAGDFQVALWMDGFLGGDFPSNDQIVVNTYFCKPLAIFIHEAKSFPLHV